MTGPAPAADRGCCPADQSEELHDGTCAGPAVLLPLDELLRREAAQGAMIEHDGEDFPNLAFLDRKAALAWRLCDKGRHPT